MEEPSVLDYLKSRLTPWRGKKIEIPDLDSEAPAPEGEGSEISTSGEASLSGTSEVVSDRPMESVHPVQAIQRIVLPWRVLLGFALALVAQLSLEPSQERGWQLGVVLYLLGAGSLAWAYLRGELQVSSALPATNGVPEVVRVRIPALLLSCALGVLAFLSFGGNRFTGWNVTLWALSILGLLRAFWQGDWRLAPVLRRMRARIAQGEWRFTFDRWTLLVLTAAAVVIFFRAYRLEQVPPEMVSDHAEKLLDIWDVMNGNPSIFFPRNTGREAMQMYLTAAMIRLFGTGYSFLSLKIGTVLAGLLTLPYLYLLGKEFGNRRIGLYAMLFAGIAYWPNVISRVGLRFPLYPLFVAPTLYYLLRGLRTSRLNDFLLAGLALGIGLHGYTPIRILPLLILAAILLYVMHGAPREGKAQAGNGLLLLVLAAIFVFLPLMRFALENPSMFSFRSFSRLGTVEQPLPGPALQIFFSNVWRAIIAFAWDDGEIWVHSVMHRPALDVVSAGFLYMGAFLLLLRYARQRDWRDLFWVLAVPILMLPSILSLAFPAENPALNRMSGAMVPVFLIVAFALDSLLETLRAHAGGKAGQLLAWVVGLFLFGWASLQNYDLVFRQYQEYYRLASWNTSEMGEVIHTFTSTAGSPEAAWVVAYPHWVDTRLVGINAGYPTRDFAIAHDDLAQTLSEPRAKLFLVKPDDNTGLDTLRQLYPNGSLKEHNSSVEGHDFWIYYVPPKSAP